MSLADEKYVSFTTYRRSGEAVPTPTWIAALPNGRYGFWTSSASGKIKRLRNNPKVAVQPSDARGKIKTGSAVVAGTAEVVSSGTDYDAVQEQIRARYGVMVRFSRVMNTIGHIGKGSYPYGDVVVVITPEP